MKIDKSLSIKLTEVNVVMTILIVWLHIAPIFNLPWWVQQMAIIAVPCFWTISSFLYFASFDFTSPFTSYKSKLLSRTRTVMVPFIVFNIFGLLFSLVLLQVHPVDYHPLEGVNAGNCLKALYHSKWNGALWYLRALFEFVLVAPLIGYVIRATKWSILLVIPIYLMCRHAPYSSFPYWMVNIFTGAFIAIWYDWLTAHYARHKKIYISTLVIILGGVVTACWLGVCDDYMIRAITSPTVIFIIMNIHIIPSVAAKVLAPYTMLIYCLHGNMMRVTSKIPHLFGIRSELLAFVLVVALTIVVIVVVQFFLKKSPRVWKLIMGGR